MSRASRVHVRSKFRHVRNFFALGFGVELYTQVDEHNEYLWTVVHVKLLLGVWVWNTDFNFRKEKVDPNAWGGEDEKEA